MHGAFNFVLTAHLFAAVASGSTRQLGACLDEAEQAVQGPRWALPLRNHDELWLGDGHLIPDDVIQSIRVGLPQGQGHWLNWGINRRLAPLLNGDPRSNRLLHGLIYSLPGMPCLYYEMSWGWGTGRGCGIGIQTGLRWPGPLPATGAFPQLLTPCWCFLRSRLPVTTTGL